jgi:predicted  nucleic acid-binding Zn-ribbon protein
MGFFGLRRAVGVLALVVVATACESTEEKCAAVRGSATQLWGSYADAMQSELEAAKASAAAAKKKLDGEINQRHEAEARRQADKLHGTETSTAWYRTFLATTKAICAKDPECLELKVQVTEGEAKVTDLTKRIGAARAAQAATTTDGEAAKNAADAVPEDTGRPAAAQASAASAELATACAGLKP